ncbi:MAG: hypothetical protein Q8M02_13995 [Candidatus Didemnitutus sp.]|nr:hypothetical protein [Candidatus Didemnitutus sp.]
MMQIDEQTEGCFFGSALFDGPQSGAEPRQFMDRFNVLLRWLFCALVFGASVNGLAQSTVQLEVENTVQSVRVLQSREFKTGNRTFVFNRVEQPVLRAKPPKTDQVGAMEIKVSAAEPARWVHQSFSGTVQGGVSELVWFDENGARQVAYSNVDFTLFAHWLGVQVDDTFFSATFFGIGDYGSELPRIEDPLLAAKVAKLRRNPIPDYVPRRVLSADDADMLDLLHAYFGVNGPELKRRADKAKAEADEAQQKAAREAAKPQRLVFNFWKSTERPKQ